MNNNDNLMVINSNAIEKLLNHLSLRFRDGDYSISESTRLLLNNAFNWQRFEKNEEYSIGFEKGKPVYAHTIDVMRALQAIVTKDASHYNDYSSSDITLEELFNLVENIDLNEDEKEILGYCALFHDIGNTVKTSGHESASGSILKKFYKSFPKSVLTKTKMDDIHWIVSRHTFMGGALFYGELSPAKFLDDKFDKLNNSVKKQRLKMLSLFGLCDLMGTGKGKFVRFEKAKYIVTRSLEKLSEEKNKLFERRVEQFNGELSIDGTPNPWKSYLFYQYFKSTRNITQQRVRKWFGKNIIEIQGAIGHFITMGPKNVLNMMVLISEILDNIEKKYPNLKIETIGFETPSSSLEAVKRLISYWRDMVFYQLEIPDIVKMAKKKTSSWNLKCPIDIGSVELRFDKNILIISTGIDSIETMIKKTLLLHNLSLVKED